MIYSWPTKCECTLVFVGFVKHLNNSNNFCPAPGCCAPPPVPTGRLLSIHMNILSCKFSLIWHSSVAPFFRSPYGMFVFWSPLARIVSHKCLILWPGYCSPSCPPDQHFITCANCWISYSQDEIAILRPLPNILHLLLLCLELILDRADKTSEYLSIVVKLWTGSHFWHSLLYCAIQWLLLVLKRSAPSWPVL